MDADSNMLTVEKSGSDTKTKLVGAIFLCGVAGISMLGGFGTKVALEKKKDPSHFYKVKYSLTSCNSESLMAIFSIVGMLQSKELPESGGRLAMRALGWGTLYAVSGFSLFCYAVCKLLGVRNLQEFRVKVDMMFPKMPRKESSEELKKVKTLRELLNYIIEEDKKKK